MKITSFVVDLNQPYHKRNAKRGKKPKKKTKNGEWKKGDVHGGYCELC